MMPKTFYVVQGYALGPRGKISPMPAKEAPDEAAAVRRAERLAASKGGAIAFAQTGDLVSEEFEEPVILARFGRVPEEAA